MTDKRSGPVSSPIKFVLWLLSLVYGLIVRLLSSGYEKRFFVPYEADPMVISIGNITVGGTGKTQAVMAIAKRLESLGKRACVLLRGYGADEYRLLQEELEENPILVGQDRQKNSKRAFYDFGADTIILDDGFQHFKIGRDLDIVLLDATNPFGNYELIPRGILREPLTALRRAELIIITKVDSAGAKLKEVYSAIDKFAKGASILEAIYKPLALYPLTLALSPEGRGNLVCPSPKGRGNTTSPSPPEGGEGRGEGKFGKGFECIKGKRVCLVSGIGNPSYFRENVLSLGPASIESEFAFLDHYNYRDKDLRAIERECRFLDVDFIIVTKKDAVKLRRLSLGGAATPPILVLDVEFRVTKNEKALNDRLCGIYHS